MRFFATFALISASALFATIAPGQSVQSTKWQERRTIKPPPPPPTNVDPQPGPFIVHLDGEGNIAPEQYKVIANAVRVWAIPGLEAFSVCYHRGPLAVERGSAFQTLKTVAIALKARGASTVVMPNGGLCDAAAPAPMLRNGSHVTIMGVVPL